MHRRDLSDAEWAILAPFFPKTPPRRGGQWKDHRTTLSGVFHRLRTGCPWRHRPGRYGPWQTVYERLTDLRKSGRLADLLSALQLRLGEAGRIDHDLDRVDGTNVRAARAAAGAAKKDPPPDEPPGHALGRSRGGFGTKLHVVTDANRLPLAVVLTGGQRQECTQFERVMDQVRVPRRRGRPRRRPPAVAGDKGYSYPPIRSWLRRHGVRAVIPRRKDQRPDDGRHRLDKARYRKRAAVEQCVGWLKENRAVGTRFDKLAVNFLASIHLAMVRRYLRELCNLTDSADRA